jgi:hypothetical protein
MKQSFLLFLFLALAAGCGQVQTPLADESAKAQTEQTIAGLAGKMPEFQARYSIAEWTPEGRETIRRLLDAVLPTLKVTGVLKGDRPDIGHYVYAKYEDGTTIYFPVNARTPERKIVALIGGKLYALEGSKQEVDQLIGWAKSQSIL